ncbi:hypothetical protein SAMN06297280_0593 [Arsukibacterium tuosuense]|uniref:Uncharacterized protein n=1 Tax=Arsukibacterium tuosuense TaxID=1323745 RepID=A0A285I661_9GAMM|nr:hypothetical protein [Arsukibacterium tuosuense]SNY43460.1 hypothetical protein SAMN06297280_0593 [Arsukibacterium tuosuense]
MLSFYRAIASKLQPLQPLWLLLALASLCWLGYLLLLAPVEVSQRWQLTALVSFAFVLNMLLMTLLFAHPSPPAVASDFWGRLQNRLRHILQYSLAWLVTILFLIIIWLFLRIALGIIAPLLF